MNQKNRPIRILFVEDLPADVEMAIREIKGEGIAFTHIVVDSESGFIHELTAFDPDIVISDYSMPGFDGMSALKITRAQSDYVPFIMLTGSMNEETAVACMKAGANDYVIKEKIKRLPFAILEVIEKVNAKKENERIYLQLQESEQRYRSLVDSANDAIVTFNGREEIVSWNKSAEAIFDYKENEVLGEPISLILPKMASGKKNQSTRNLLLQKKEGSTGITKEMKAVKKCGELFPVELSLAQWESSGLVIYTAIMRDITRRKKAEDQLILLSRALEQNPVAIVIALPDGTIQYANPAFTKTTGFELEEVIGKNPNILKSDYHPESFYETLWNTILSGNNWEGEFYNKKKNGELYWEEAIISPIVDKEGKITHFVAVKEDITQQKMLMQDLVAAKELAEKSDRLKSAFLANMSHEIRTPMNGILGFTNLLLDPDLTSEESEQYIEIIHQSGQRMLNTVTDIIEISKIEAGITSITLKEVNVNKSLVDFIRFFQPETEKKGLVLTTDVLLEMSDPVITTDQNKFDSILTNLIKNAIKFTNSGTISLGCSIKGDCIEFFVKDTGIGIPADRIDAIFNRFEQADINDTRALQGSGLGLAITKSYVEMLGGKLWVESDEGKGATFYFTLPANVNKWNEPKAGLLSSKKRKETDAIDRNKPLEILIAEDDENSFFYLKYLLEKISSKILHAENGEMAVELCRINPNIDLVLMDIKMPGINGYEATRLIRQFNGNVKIIAQTAFALSGDKEKALEAGCNHYISKPVSKNDLMKLIKTVFKRD